MSASDNLSVDGEGTSKHTEESTENTNVLVIPAEEEVTTITLEIPSEYDDLTASS